MAAVFDPDEAGRKALARSLELFLAGNVHARAVILPDGHDPDDFVRTHGREKMEDLVAHAWPMADYYIEQILGGRGTLEEDRDKLREAVSFLSRIEDDVERNLFIKKVAEALDVDEEVLKTEVRRTLSHSPSAVPADLPRRTTAAEMDPSGTEPDPDDAGISGKGIDRAGVGGSGLFQDGGTEVVGREASGRRTGREGRCRTHHPSSAALTEGPLREKLLALLVQESPYPEELIDRLMADTIRKIRERSNKERSKILTRRIREAERAGNGNW